MREIRRWPVNSPHKWSVTREMVPFDDIIMYDWFRMKDIQNVHTLKRDCRNFDEISSQLLVPSLVKISSKWHFVVANMKVFHYANRIWWLYRSTLVEVIKTISSANWPLGSGIIGPFKWIGNHTYLGLKNNWGMQSKNGLQNVWGNIFSVKELDVIVHKKNIPITMSNFGYSIPHLTSEPGGWGGN